MCFFSLVKLWIYHLCIISMDLCHGFIFFRNNSCWSYFMPHVAACVTVVFTSIHPLICSTIWFICFLVFARREKMNIKKLIFSALCLAQTDSDICSLWTIGSGASPHPVKTKSKKKPTESEDEESWVVSDKTASWVSPLLPIISYLWIDVSIHVMTVLT